MSEFFLLIYYVPLFMRGCIVPGGLSVVTDRGHNDSALTPGHVAFEMENLVPGT
jgi:hypothetical protein